MNEFFTEITNPANLTATVFLGVVMLYWILVILGAVGMDAIDFDLDADADADLDFDLGEGLLGSLLVFFHIGQVPVMLLASFFALYFWLTTICTNHIYNPDLSFAWALIFVAPCALVSLLMSKISVMPIARVFQSEEKEWNRDELLGKKATVHTLKLTDKYGEIVIETDGPPLVLNARNERGQTLKQGDVVKIIEHDREDDICLVELAKWESK